MREPAHQFVVSVPRPAAPSEPPRKLTPAEANARLAELGLGWRHREEALRLAGEALQAEPANETALRVAAIASLEGGQFEAALAAVDKLAAVPSPTAATLTDSGEVLVRLGHAVAKKEVTLGIDVQLLAQRAAAAFEKAIAVDAGYLRAWSGLAYLHGSMRDNEAARALAARATPVMEQHLYSGALARALATMCAQTGQADRAFLFGEYWRDDAINQTDHEQAVAFIARLNPIPQPAADGH